MIRRALFLGLALASSARAANWWEITYKPVDYSQSQFGNAHTIAPETRLVLGARPAALGGAYLAVADDSQSLLYNPAGLLHLREVELSGTHLEMPDGVRDDSVSLGVPMFGFGAWGLGATYLYASDMGRDNWGTETGSFNIFSFSLQAAFALQLGDDSGVGLTYRILRQGLENRVNMGSAFDLGAQWGGFFDRKLTLALGSTSMGTDMALGAGNAPLGWAVKGGLSYLPLRDWMLSGEFEHLPQEGINKWRLGTEYTLGAAADGAVALRGGYVFGPENAAGPLSGLSLGLGGQLNRFKLDYAWAPLGDLGQSHRVSLAMGFGQR